jgi:hypothetical protein
MPEQDTDVLEVLVSQVGECGNADPIFSKAFCILPETELRASRRPAASPQRL